MNRKFIIPIVLCSIVVISVLFTCLGGKSKITLEWEKDTLSMPVIDSIELKVYVENSGSMDAYMCPGSNLKDAVFDYISDLKKYSSSSYLFYINSRIIPYSGNLESYIKDLTPQSFANAGGHRGNTDLRKIFSDIMSFHKNNTISILISDCILDIPENAIDYFGNCQVHIKNVFNDALTKNPYLGVEIIQLESKFDGYWYCGKNSQKLSNVKRPYYIWLIGDQRVLARLNKSVNVNDILGGIKNYCAFASSQSIPFTFEKTTYKVNHTNKIKVEVISNLLSSLQNELIIRNTANYKPLNPSQVAVTRISKIDNKDTQYSHVIELEISNPETLKQESITFTYPYLASWVESSNDSTGTDIDKNMDKTTGILFLIKGVAEAYKTHTDYGVITFNLKNK